MERSTGALDRFLMSFLLFVFGVPVFAQPPGRLPADVEQALAAIRPQAIGAHMRFLADDLLEGREAATRGYDLAAKYVAASLEALGLEPAGSGGSYFQPVPLLRMTGVEPDSSLVVLRDGRRTELRAGEDFMIAPASEKDSTITAPVVFVGFGVTAPELGYDDYAGVDVRGKIVVALVGAPPTFPHDQRAYYSDPKVHFGNALARGAVASLGIWTPKAEATLASWEGLRRESRRSRLSWLDEEGRAQGRAPELRGTALLRWKAAQELFAGAPHSLEEAVAAAESGRPLPFDLPIQVSLRSVSRHERTESPNVAAVLRGSDPRLREEYVVLSAHLDHVGVGEPVAGDSIYNGAYDNASGVAILLEVANALARLPVRPRRSVLFLFVTAEESRLQGSDFFVHRPTVPIDRIVANVNLDGCLMLYPLRDVIAFGANHSSLAAVVEQATRQLGIAVSPDPFPEQVLFLRSDQYSFIRRGIPAIFLVGGFQTGDPALDGRAIWSKWLQEAYHRPSDDMSQVIDLGVGAQFAKLNVLVTYLIAQDEEAPDWNPGDFFGEKFTHRQQGGGPTVCRLTS